MNASSFYSPRVNLRFPKVADELVSVKQFRLFFGDLTDSMAKSVTQRFPENVALGHVESLSMSPEPPSK